MKSLNMEAGELQLKDMIREVDADGSGSIDFKEFLSMLTRQKNSVDRNQELAETFKVFDVDGNGVISANELRDVMNSIGEKITQAELEQMIQEADINGDGNINYEEFMKMLGAK
ncbi:hypothetical protein BJV82DRAFT_179078 [Fennellomyces sp. T-0311]|nr:hypothetical protein BJV82DRAFT_179078 [Fennellomyces sp. T-0311]